MQILAIEKKCSILIIKLYCYFAIKSLTIIVSQFRSYLIAVKL